MILKPALSATLLLLLILRGLDALRFNETIEKAAFKRYFIQTYKLHFTSKTNNNNNNNDNEGEKETIFLVRRNVQTKGFDQGNKLLKDAFNRHQQAANLNKIQKISRNGTTDDKLDIIAEQIWNRLGAEIVEKTLITVGTVVGSQLGGYVGGTLGMAIGMVVPPLQIPLVIGGVFVGKNLGRVLGAIGGKITSDFVNNMIADSVIGRLVVKKIYTLMSGMITNATTSAAVICRSDICPKGKIQHKCKCVTCNGPMHYSDQDGLSSCKTCSLGSYPILNYYRQNVGCRQCPKGTIGKSDGKCYNCNGKMDYGDSEGAVSCKSCQVGTVPFHDYYQRNVGCSPCREGKIGKSDGLCHKCDGPMEYQGTRGATACKKCPLGQVPSRDYNRYQVGCSPCREGKIGKSDGLCHKCMI